MTEELAEVALIRALENCPRPASFASEALEEALRSVGQELELGPPPILWMPAVGRYRPQRVSAPV